MNTTDYYMMSLRQKITSIKKFASLGKLLAQLCCDPAFQIINGIQSYGDYVMESSRTRWTQSGGISTQVYCVWAKQQQGTWITRTIYSAHY